MSVDKETQRKIEKWADIQIAIQKKKKAAKKLRQKRRKRGIKLPQDYCN